MDTFSDVKCFVLSRRPIILWLFLVSVYLGNSLELSVILYCIKNEPFQGSKAVTEKNVPEKNAASKITLQRAARGKNKSVTVIKGLASFGKSS